MKAAQAASAQRTPGSIVRVRVPVSSLAIVPSGTVGVTRGRILLAVERYKKGDVSVGRAAELAGVPVGRMMTILTEYGVEGRIEDEDYLQGLAGLRKAW